MAVDDTSINFQVIAAADNPVPVFNEVVRYWEQQRGSAFAPPWSAINLLDFTPELLPYCIVVDLHETDDRVSYRYFGSGIAQLHGFELTNRTSDAIEPPALREHIVSQYRSVVEARKPQFIATELVVKDGLKLQHLLLRLPLSDDGRAVTNVITFENFGDHRKELHEYYSAMSEKSAGYLSEPFDK